MQSRSGDGINCNLFSKPRQIPQHAVVEDSTDSDQNDEDRGRNTQRPILTERRNARSSSRDQIRVGDRVIVKEKYIGTCRYVGPIEEKYILPEIFIGVELDEPLTNNSGIFGSRQYFDCEYGYGLMVSSAKVRKIRDVTFKDKVQSIFAGRSKSVGRTKSVSGINLEKGVTINRISRGYRQKEFGRSRSMLHSSMKPHDNTMQTLNHLKHLQDIGMGPALHGWPRDLSPHSLSYQSQPYGYPVQFQDSSPSSAFPGTDLLRESFRRIVAPIHHPHHQYGYAGLDQPLYRNISAPAGRSTTVQRSFSDMNAMDRTRSLPNKPIFASQRKISNASGYSSSQNSFEQNFGPAVPDQSYYYYRYSQPLCPTCASCKTCSPLKMPISTGSVHEHQPVISQPVIRKYSQESGISSDTSSTKCPPLGKKSAKVKRNSSVSSIDSIEYEKWKANYGKAIGRGMKKGLNKLTAGLLYT